MKPASRDQRRRGQSLVEFAVSVPVLILLVAGMLELGRGYAISVGTNDAARDGARIATGAAASGLGPGLSGICSLVTADLAAVTASVSCATQVAHAPPFVSGTDFVPPSSGQATVVVYCGSSGNCQGASGTVYHTTIAVSVYYRFDDLNLLGGGILISGASQMTTSW